MPASRGGVDAVASVSYIYSYRLHTLTPPPQPRTKSDKFMHDAGDFSRYHSSLQ